MGLFDYFRRRPALTDGRATDSTPGNPAQLGSWWGRASRLVNMMTGAGSYTDKASAWRWQIGGQLTEIELQAMDRSGAYEQICCRLANAALGQAPTVTYPDDPEAGERLTDRAASLGLWGNAAWAAGRAQMDGVAGLLIVSEGSPTDPIDGDRVVRLHPLTRWEMRPEGWDEDIASPTFGSPLMIRVRARINGRRYERLVDRSRVILFKGRKPNGDDYRTNVGDGWDDYGWPYAVWIEEALRALTIHGQEIPRQMATLNLLVHGVSLDGLDAALMQDGQDAVIATIRQLRDRTSSAGVVGKAPGETLERLESRLTGIAELTDGAFKQVSLNSATPGEALTGQPPAGLGNGDKGARLTLGSQAAAFAETYLRIPLQYALGVLCAESGLDAGKVKMEFADAIPVTEAEYAALYEATTRADLMLLTAGVLTADEVRAMRFNSGTWSASAAPIPERTVSDPTASAELRAAILGTMATEQTTEPVQTEATTEGEQTAPPASTEPLAEQTAASAAVAAAEQIPVGFVSAAKELAIEVYAGRMAPDPARAILEMINVPAHLAARIAPDVPAAVVLPPPPTTTTGEPATVDPAQTAQDASPLSALVALIPDAPTVEALASVRDAVTAIVPDLDPETWPHLTVLYAGDIPQSRVRALRGTVAERLPDLSADIDGDLTVKGLEVWPDGERSAIVLRVGGAGLTRAHNVLWGALTPLMTAQQHPTYKAHITIGYVQGALAPDTMEALQALALPETVNMGEAILRHGERQLLAVNMTR